MKTLLMTFTGLILATYSSAGVASEEYNWFTDSTADKIMAKIGQVISYSKVGRDGNISKPQFISLGEYITSDNEDTSPYELPYMKYTILISDSETKKLLESIPTEGTLEQVAKIESALKDLNSKVLFEEMVLKAALARVKNNPDDAAYYSSNAKKLLIKEAMSDDEKKKIEADIVNTINRYASIKLADPELKEFLAGIYGDEAENVFIDDFFRHKLMLAEVVRYKDIDPLREALLLLKNRTKKELSIISEVNGLRALGLHREAIKLINKILNERENGKLKDLSSGLVLWLKDQKSNSSQDLVSCEMRTQLGSVNSRFQIVDDQMSDLAFLLGSTVKSQPMYVALDDHDEIKPQMITDPKLLADIRETLPQPQATPEGSAPSPTPINAPTPSNATTQPAGSPVSAPVNAKDKEIAELREQLKKEKERAEKLKADLKADDDVEGEKGDKPKGKKVLADDGTEFYETFGVTKEQYEQLFKYRSLFANDVAQNPIDALATPVGMAVMQRDYLNYMFSPIRDRINSMARMPSLNIGENLYMGDYSYNRTGLEMGDLSRILELNNGLSSMPLSYDSFRLGNPYLGANGFGATNLGNLTGQSAMTNFDFMQNGMNSAFSISNLAARNAMNAAGMVPGILPGVMNAFNPGNYNLTQIGR